jgi:hypothetical protein
MGAHPSAPRPGGSTASIAIRGTRVTAFAPPLPGYKAGREVAVLPEKKHVRGVGQKEQRQYEHIKEDAQKSGRYGKRAKEVAARTVMKQHKEKGHSKGR